ncbi:MAG: pantetheine-phosphate adenylyltransferase [Alphaproteobacteria bacterium]|nr:pantetheine-phosphate adenylyltransferase [Alphaproteobacteria bacterium]
MEKVQKIAVYPGTFDPFTSGHMDIVNRVLPLVDHLIIAVSQHSEKNPLFSVDERVSLITHELSQTCKSVSHQTTVEVLSFEGLLVTFAKNVKAQMIIRGLRAVSDFEYEFMMAAMNARLGPEIETLFLMASDHFQFISSQVVKEVARLGGDVSQFVSPYIDQKLKERFFLQN